MEIELDDKKNNKLCKPKSTDELTKFCKKNFFGVKEL